MSRPLDHVPELTELLAYADPHDPLVWVRDDRGCVGAGEALRLTFSGAGRFTQAAEAWRAIAAQATVDDRVGLPGSGLIAFAALAFADTSHAESVVIVPRHILAVHGDRAWVTEISLTTDTSAAAAEAEPQLAPSLPTPHPIGAFQGTELAIDAPDDAYLRAVVEATDRLSRGDIEKVVLARNVRGEIAAEDDLRVPLTRLATRYDDCWTFAVDGLVGASPETLLRRIGGTVSARVLAGTRGRKADPAADVKARDDLIASQKEQHEHAFAVQSVVTALGPYVRELRSSPEPFPLELPNVWHLATDLVAEPSRDAMSLELAGALHPTAAVAGTPTRDAVQMIDELEPFDRERYSGAVGWIDAAGDGEWVIALRCAQIEQAADGQRTLTAYAGGGILADSDPAREFGETISKLRPIAEAFSAPAAPAPAAAPSPVQ